MATPRPSLMDLQSRTNSAASSYRVAPSERMQHFAGDIPPVLSPLDAFAAHSRRLAKELEETRKAGQRRISRLPPHVVTESLTQHQANRPHYFRSLSAGPSPVGQENEGQGNSPKFAEPTTRPVSEYPQISGVPNPNVGDDKVFATSAELHQKPNPPNYFGAPRAESPDHVDDLSIADASKAAAQHQISRPRPPIPHPNMTLTLAPPNAPFARNTNYNRYREPSDDDNTSSNAGSTFSHTRKLSSNSGISLPHSPISALVVPRSPSTNSEMSMPGNAGSRLHLNFSRPMSSTSLQNLREWPSRQQSKGSQTGQLSPHSFDLPRTPLSFDEVRPRRSEDSFLEATSSHTYGKLSLPRGRMADCESPISSGPSAPHSEWQEPMLPSTPPRNTTKDTNLASPSPLRSTRPSEDLGGRVRGGNTGSSVEFGSNRCASCEKPRRPTTSHSTASSVKSLTSSPLKPSTSQGSSWSMMLPPIPTTSKLELIQEPTQKPTQEPQKPTQEPQKPTQEPQKPTQEPTQEPKQEQSLSSRSNSTVRPHSVQTNRNYESHSIDEHVTKAIELHQHGDLKESTYHLRIAAKHDHPTGMLLYALACRHGWGMRPNPQEGVQWLRKAMDSAMLEVAEDEKPGSQTAAKDVNEKKAHRAQFALSIYELGVSHLNGWGTEQDKALALRCFEIAGDWGDVDALTEAGFCYAEGIGCKKDLKMAAKFYRLAAAKGVSMVGNSW
jgi:Sel1 repeat